MYSCHLFRYKTFALLLACQCLWLTTSAQVAIGRIITGRKLQWTDFKGNADTSSPYSATTNWSVSYRAHVDSIHADTVFLSFRVMPVFNNYTSWVKKEKIKRKKESEALLQHEQGHYDLAIICAETLKQTLLTTPFLKNNYSAKADSIADATLKLFTRIEDDYDLQTNHMLNHGEQMKWNENIRKLLILSCN